MPGEFTNNTIVVSPNSTTTYTLTSYDACGNSSTDEVTVFVDEPFADAGPDADICISQDITLTANDTPNGIWVWTDMLTNQTYTGREITVSPPTSRQYCVDVTDNCGNTLTDCIFVTVFQLTVDAGTGPVICAGNVTDLSGSSSTGSGIFTWTDGTNTYTGQTVQVSPQITTLYTLTVDDGCIATDQVTVTVNPLPLVSATSSVGSICPDEQLTLSASGALSYVWSADQSDAILAGHETEQNPVAGPTVNTNYTVTGTDVNGCMNTAIVGIAVKEQMFADFNLSQSAVCEGDQTVVTYAGNGLGNAIYTWDWDGGNVTTSGQGPHSVSWTSAGMHIVRLSVTEAGCQSVEFTQDIQVNAMPVAGFSNGIAEGCVPHTVNFTDNSLNAATGVTYNWDFGSAGNGQAQNISQEFTIPGEYNVTLTVTNPGGCVSQKNMTGLVNAWPLPVATFDASPSNTSLKNPIIQFSSSSTGDNISLLWNTGDGTTYDTPAFSHTYTVSDYFDVLLTVTNSYGCIDSVLKQVYVSPRYMLLIPNAFTPNGDGRNDFFVVQGSGVKEYGISIFNRWGSLIFFTNDITESWDGTVSGQPVGKGIYVFRTYFRDENDEVSEQTGVINLIK